MDGFKEQRGLEIFGQFQRMPRNPMMQGQKRIEENDSYKVTKG